MSRDNCPMKQDSWTLRYASDTLKDNKEFILEAIQYDVRALEYASDALKNDREVVLEAVKQSNPTLKDASDALQLDPVLRYLGAYHFTVNLSGQENPYEVKIHKIYNYNIDLNTDHDIATLEYLLFSQLVEKLPKLQEEAMTIKFDDADIWKKLFQKVSETMQDKNVVDDNIRNRFNHIQISLPDGSSASMAEFLKPGADVTETKTSKLKNGEKEKGNVK